MLNTGTVRTDPHPPELRGRRILNNIAVCVLIAAFCVAVLPRSLTGMVYVRGVFWTKYVYVGTALFLSAYIALRAKDIRIPRYLVIAVLTTILPPLATGLFHTEPGLNHIFSAQTYANDAILFLMFAQGIVIGTLFDESTMKRFCALLLVSLTAILTVGMLLLLTGLMKQVVESIRIYDPSMFAVEFMTLVLAPCLWWIADDSTSGRKDRLVSISAVAVMAAFGIISATRSVVLTAIVCACLMAAKYVRNPRYLFTTTHGLCMIAGVFALTGLCAFGFSGELLNRFETTNILSETRFMELNALTDSIGFTSPFGMGAGSILIWTKPDGLAQDSPWLHVGVATCYMKGGLLMTCGLVALAFTTGWKLINSNVPRFARGAACAIIVYLFHACLSSGFDGMEVLLLGMMTAILTTCAAPVSSGSTPQTEDARDIDSDCDTEPTGRP